MAHLVLSTLLSSSRSIILPFSLMQNQQSIFETCARCSNTLISSLDNLHLLAFILHVILSTLELFPSFLGTKVVLFIHTTKYFPRFNIILTLYKVNPTDKTCSIRIITTIGIHCNTLEHFLNSLVTYLV